MAYSARIIADSVSPCDIRLTTMEVTFPRIILAEFNTHRMFSRNSASSRAIPVEKMIEKVCTDPFIPSRFPKNQKGMQAAEYFEPESEEYKEAAAAWLVARNDAVYAAKKMIELGVHKQIANRLLEPWLWHTVIVTATQWSNFFAQRCHPDAQPEIQTIAYRMKALLDENKPVPVYTGDYHLPFLQPDEHDLTLEQKIKLCAARCARVSYLSHDGKRDHEADYQLYNRLITGMHMSPLEHVAYARLHPETCGNFIGWVQHRKVIPNECR